MQRGGSVAEGSRNLKTSWRTSSFSIRRGCMLVSLISCGDVDEGVDGVDYRPPLNIDFDGGLSDIAKQLGLPGPSHG